jgi:photosystem II stability/assembly factor-like uncharacterized protein
MYLNSHAKFLRFVSVFRFAIQTGICAVLLLFSIAAFAGQAGWSWIGPRVPSRMTKILPDQINPNYWYAIADQTLLCSYDGGLSWQKSNLGSVIEIAQHPQTQDLYAVTQGSKDVLIWKSNNFAKSFSFFASVRTSFVVKTQIHFTPDETDRVFVVLGNDLVLISSKEKPNYFTNYPVRLDEFYTKYAGQDCHTQNFIFEDFAVSSFDPNVYIATAGPEYDCGPHNRGFYDPFIIVSSNAGKSWRIIRRLRQREAYKILFEPQISPNLYIYGADGLFLYSLNRLQPIASFAIESLTHASANPKELFAIANTYDPSNGEENIKLLRSINGGKSWTSDPNDLQDRITEIASSIDGRVNLASLRNQGIYRRTRGTKWQLITRGLPAALITDVENSAGKKMLYLNGDSFYSSSDASKIWNDLSEKLPLKDLSSGGQLKTHPVLNQTLFFASSGVTHSGLFRSDDGGKSWTLLSGGQWRIAGIPYSNQKAAYLIDFDANQLYKVDEVHTKPLPIGPQFNGGLSIEINPSDPRVIFYSSSGESFISEDEGSTVRRILSIRSVAEFPQSGKYLALRGEDVIFTNDAFRSTQKLSKLPHASKIFPADFRGSKFWAIVDLSFRKQAIFESKDAGRSWKEFTRIPEELSPATKNMLRFGTTIYDVTDARYPVIYFATSLGIYRYQK